MTQEQYYWFVRRQQLLKLNAQHMTGAGHSMSYSLTKMQPYVYQAEYEKLDADYYAWAEQYYRKTTMPAGKCSGVVSADRRFHGRNLDWYYNENIAVIARTKASAECHASIGTCLTTVSENDMCSGHQLGDVVKIIPFTLDDGINDAGLTIQINVIPHKGIWKTDSDRSMHPRMVVRTVLDHFSKATAAAEYICRHGYSIPEAAFDYHWLIADKDSVWLVEDGEAIDVTDRPYMTNFRTAIDPRKESDLTAADWSKIAAIDAYSIGIERYETILKNYDESATADGMMKLMHEQLKYTNAYDSNVSPRWLSESCGVYPAFTDMEGKPLYLTVEDVKDNTRFGELPAPLEDFSGMIKSEAFFIYSQMMSEQTPETRAEGHSSWQSTWSTVYDRQNLSMTAIFQEGEFVAEPVTVYL